ncbi:MAG: ABC transporter ATP-binding protein [Candidatus Aminicenantes bacterium]|nr:ABC transporter ATP-binding protein [Candidatus Aminicenantes bacterium]
MNVLNQKNPVRLSDVTKYFESGGNRTYALKNISLEVGRGELILFLGPSGSGKTTLLTMMAGLIKPSKGSVFLFNRKVDTYSPKELQKLRACSLGFIFQTFLLIDSLTVLENLRVVLRFSGYPRKETNQKAIRLLQQFHIEELAGKFPVCLSQGEKQRVAVARAVANDASLILADEPTGSLESKQGFEVISLLKKLSETEDKSVVIASHDLRIVEFADRVFRLEDGSIRGNRPASFRPLKPYSASEHQIFAGNG